MKTAIALALVAPLLSGCITANLGSSGSAKCPPRYKWSKDFANRLASEVSRLPAETPTRVAIEELLEVREWIEENCK